MIDFILGLSPGVMVAAIVAAFIALVSQMSLYAKAGQPPLAALVPVWNVVIFCKVVGRPAIHSLLIVGPGLIMAGAVAAYWPVIDGLFPQYTAQGKIIAGTSVMSDATIPFIIIGVAAIPLILIIIQMFTEVCDSFGKHKTSDKVSAVIFNGAYILFVLGISDAEYESPWWARKRGKPYYMPDFKHKGKKYLVTPEGPLEGDWKNQKLKVKIVDEKADPLHGVEAPEAESGFDKKEEAPKKEETPKKVAASKQSETPKSDTKTSGKNWREEALEKYKKKK